MQPDACRTAADVKAYLMFWLQPVEETQQATVEFTRRVWVHTEGFRSGFCDHNVWMCRATGEYAFHVTAAAAGLCHCDTPNFGVHATYNAMLDAVAEQYAGLWKLHE